MNNEISEEAKRTLADLPRRKALQRLERDGATSRPAMQRRILALAAERSIPPADFHKLMYKRINTRDVMAFCEKHKISFDWLLCGDLKGLQRMTEEAKGTSSGSLDGRIVQLGRSFEALPPEKQKLALLVLQELMTRSTPNG
jgi:hypothetical protein